MMTNQPNLLDRLRVVTMARPGEIAISNENSAFTYKELIDAVQSLSGKLIRFHENLSTVAPKENVGTPLIVYLSLNGGPEMVALQLAVMASGNVAVPVSCNTTTYEASNYFNKAHPDIICVQSIQCAKGIIDALTKKTQIVILKTDGVENEKFHHVIGWHDLLQPECSMLFRETGSTALPIGTSMIQFTSGSTGLPKALIISESNLLANLDLNSDYLSEFENKHVFCPVPLSHSMGNSMVLEHLFHGSSIHLANNFLIGEHTKRLVNYCCTAVLASPNYFRMIGSKLGNDVFSKIDTVTIGSDRIDGSLIETIHRKRPNVTIFCRYGLSEAVGALAYHTIHPGESIYRSGIIGKLIPGIELSYPSEYVSKEEGFPLIVKSPTAATGILTEGGRISTMDGNGYLNTGDLVCTAKCGNLVLVGRENQFIKKNGFRINPCEIEEVLRSVPGVRSAVVVGINDSAKSQKIVACIEGEGVDTLDPRKLLSACMKNLSSHKLPGEFLFNIKIPLTSSGKPAREELVKMLNSKSESDQEPVEIANLEYSNS